MMPEIRRNFRLPKTSERDAAGKLTNIPGIVEAEATKPVQAAGVSRNDAKSFRTGFLERVVLRMAKNPMMQIARKMLSLAFFPRETIGRPASEFAEC